MIFAYNDGRRCKMELVLETFGLCKRYKNNIALENVNLRVGKGEIFGLIGQNGAGKTTLMRIVAGIQEPSAGTFTLFGASSAAKGIYGARRRMGGIIETPSLQANLTAEQNLKAQCILRGCPSYDSVEELLRYVGLYDVKGREVKDMSLGMRQRLAIACALIGEPDFLMLDEPINGLDPSGIIEIRELILKLNRERKVTVLISSHILSELSKLATNYGFMNKWHLVEEIYAERLNELCKKKTLIRVSNTTKLPALFDGKGLSYKILSPHGAELYSDIAVGELSGMIATAGETLLDFRVEEEDLETYYMNVVGGEKNG